MDDSIRVLNHGAGPLSSTIMFVGEAPGRLGADASALAFHGDKAGDNFEKLLAQAHISRYDVFITNAVLCNPKDDRGNNATPSPQEIANCANFLRQQVDIVNPKIVVSLGVTALKALSLVASHSLDLRTHVRTANAWFGRTLIPLYHPGQRAMMHRSLINQLSDYQFVASFLAKLTAKPRRRSATLRQGIEPVVRAILKTKSQLSYFALHKLFYLVEVEAVKCTGHRITQGYFIRQKDGPYCTDLHVRKLCAQVSGLTATQRDGKLFIRLDRTPSLFDPMPESINAELTGIVGSVLRRYGDSTDDQLKTAAYLTRPMKAILRQERAKTMALMNVPLDFELVLRPNGAKEPS